MLETLELMPVAKYDAMIAEALQMVQDLRKARADNIVAKSAFSVGQQVSIGGTLCLITGLRAHAKDACVLVEHRKRLASGKFGNAFHVHFEKVT